GSYTLEQVQNNDDNNVFANERQHSENNTAECADERVALANLIANLTLDTDENKTILKQLKKAKLTLMRLVGLWGRLLVVGIVILLHFRTNINKLEKYIAFNDRTIDYEILQTKLNDTL
ncbi:hypothetical protein Tco_0333812, partial [Tanacetum coccineum]